METDRACELVAVIAPLRVRGAGTVGLALVLFLIGVAAEVVLFCEKEPILAAQEIGGGKACYAAADDDDTGGARCLRAFETMTLANLIADCETFAVNERPAAWLFVLGRPQCPLPASHRHPHTPPPT